MIWGQIGNHSVNGVTKWRVYYTHTHAQIHIYVRVHMQVNLIPYRLVKVQ